MSPWPPSTCSFAFFNVIYWDKKEKKLHTREELSVARGLTEGALTVLNAHLVPEFHFFLQIGIGEVLAKDLTSILWAILNLGWIGIRGGCV